MTTFLRLLGENDKASSLLASCNAVRAESVDSRVFHVMPESFRAVPGAPFAYWVSDDIRQIFLRFPPLECDERTARQGLATAEDFRFVRTWWEEPGKGWYLFAKGGTYSTFYADIYLLANWSNDGAEVKAGICTRYPYLNGNAEFVAKNPQFYFRPGLTWPRRTSSGLGLRAMPRGCIFADKGPAAFVPDDSPNELLALCALSNSQAFRLLVSLQLAAADAAARSYEVGVIQKTPIPSLSKDQRFRLGTLARRAWSLKRTLDSIDETSHAFALPAGLRARLGDYDPPAIEAELERIQSEIDEFAFELYGFSDTDRIAVEVLHTVALDSDTSLRTDEDDHEDNDQPIDQMAGLLSWAVGVAFGRFDWRLAAGERLAATAPDPFAKLPEKSPGMLPNEVQPFHAHAGILPDDPGHKQDITRVVEEVLNRVDASVSNDVHRWLQRDFFAFHLQRYSKSRRKAPIYWPLATTSGSYTLWIYYPQITNQTLYTALNDFLEPKLKQVSADVATLRNKSARTRDDEKQFESIQTFELELTELRDLLLKIASTYKPKRDDGVQIGAAPLWPLFRHKHWQRVLKDTWTKLEKGEYDWAHAAMNYWPERVREKCKTDKSLAIAHGLEHLYVEPDSSTKKAQKRKQTGGNA